VAVIGDAMDQDILGGMTAEMDTCLVAATGLHAGNFKGMSNLSDLEKTLNNLVIAHNNVRPTFIVPALSGAAPYRIANIENAPRARHSRPLFISSIAFIECIFALYHVKSQFDFTCISRDDQINRYKRKTNTADPFHDFVTCFLPRCVRFGDRPFNTIRPLLGALRNKQKD
jgi:hypothetical protein